MWVYGLLPDVLALVDWRRCFLTRHNPVPLCEAAKGKCEVLAMEKFQLEAPKSPLKFFGLWLQAQKVGCRSTDSGITMFRAGRRYVSVPSLLATHVSTFATLQLASSLQGLGMLGDQL